MDEAELSAVRDFVDPSVFQWLFSDGSLESEVSEAPNPGSVKNGAACSSSVFKKSSEKDLKYRQELNNNSNTSMSTTGRGSCLT